MMHAVRYQGMIVLATALSLTPAHSTGAQPLPYDHTALIHGYASSSNMWTDIRPSLNYVSTRGFLQQRVDLKQVWTPSWDATTPFSTEWQDVRHRIETVSGNHVLVGHSAGGLVARYAFLQADPGTRARIPGILTVASPHQGAILADSMAKVGAFALDLERRVNAALNLLGPFVGLLNSLLEKLGFAPGVPGLFQSLFVNIPHVDVPTELTSVAILPALRTTSQEVADLNATLFDNNIPRANLKARLGNNKFMPIKLFAAYLNMEEQNAIDLFQKGRSAVTVCKYVFYATIRHWGKGRTCGFADRMLGRLDATWQRYSSGTINGRPRDVPSDGVVPNERSVYPSEYSGTFREFEPVVGANHMSVYKRMDGAQRMQDALLFLGMVELNNTPPPSLNVTINGNSSIAPGNYCQWYAAVTSGTPPYSYQWTVDGQPMGDAPDLYYANNGNPFVLAVTVTDANQLQMTVDLAVDIDENAYCS